MIIIAGKEYGRAEDLAQAFGTSKHTIWRWVRQGRIPKGMKTPRGMIWQMERLADFLNRGQVSEKHMRMLLNGYR